MYYQDLLDEVTKLPCSRGQFEGPIRRSVSRDGEQLGTGTRRWQQRSPWLEQFRSRSPRGSEQATPLQLPAEALQSRTQAAGSKGSRVLGAVAAILRAQPQAGHLGYARSPVQRHQYRRGRLRPDVLRSWLQDAGSHRL